MLRSVTWNCRTGGFRSKAAHVAPLRPDLLAVQEVERLEQVKISGGEHQPTYMDRIGDPAFPRRAIGVFSFTGLDIRAVDLEAPLNAFRRYRRARVPQVAGDALSESGSSANARQTNAASLNSPHHHLPTLLPCPVRSGWYSVELRAGL